MKCPTGYEYVKSYKKRNGIVINGYCRESINKMKFKKYRGGEYKLPNGQLIAREGRDYVLYEEDPEVNGLFDVDSFKSKKEVDDYIEKINREYKQELKMEDSLFKDYLKDNRMSAREYMKRR